MKAVITLLLAGVLAGGAAAASSQLSGDEQRTLRDRLTARYDVVPLSDGIALRPKTRSADVRLIEVSGGTVVVNGTPVTGRELRERVGGDADPILRLSYMSADDQRAMFAPPVEAPTPPKEREPAVERERGDPVAGEARERRRQRGRERIRIFGDVSVGRDEEISQQVVAVLGSVRVDGVVGGEVVAVLGSVDLGPEAVVRGDIVAVGGRVRRAPGAQTHGSVTEVSVADWNFGVGISPRPMDWWGPFHWSGNFGAVPRLIGSTFRVMLLLLLTGIAFLIARGTVESAAQRVNDNPIKATVIGLLAEVLIPPVLLLTAIVLAITLIGIPLLLLLPFLVLILIFLAILGFAGTSAAVGQWVQRRFGLGDGSPFITIWIGLLVILSPILIGRILGLAGWPVSPFALMFVLVGFTVELLAWASGFGAVLSNTFGRWQSHRMARTRPGGPVTTTT